METQHPMTALICDPGGRVRGVSVPGNKARDALRHGVVVSNEFLQAIPPVEGVHPTVPALLRLVPDVSTRFSARAHSGAASDLVLCDIESADGSEWEGCPRRFLRKSLETLLGGFGLEVACGFEFRFALIGGEEQAVGSRKAAQMCEHRNRLFGADLAPVLRDAGVDIECWGTVPDTGEMAVVTRPRPALSAADSVVVFRELLEAVALSRELCAVPRSVSAGNSRAYGTALRIDLFDQGDHVAQRQGGGRSAVLERFLSGVDRHLSAFRDFVVSNRTCGEQAMTGEAGVPIRVRVNPEIELPQQPTRGFSLEVLADDGSANPYLQLGAIVLAGARGLATDRAAASEREGQERREADDLRGVEGVPGG